MADLLKGGVREEQCMLYELVAASWFVEWHVALQCYIILCCLFESSIPFSVLNFFRARPIIYRSKT